MIQPGRGDATVHAGNDAQTEGKEGMWIVAIIFPFIS